MSLTLLSDESILRYHADMRSMVMQNAGVDGQSLLGERARKRAQDIENELNRGGITFESIVWPAP
ncbi:hypothetical protein ACWX0K_23625 [Nitrobacteraceae bacterium UC4446_H13]